MPGVGETLPTVLAGVQLHARVNLHVRLELVGLPELPTAHGALVRFLPCVDQAVAVVVLWCPELFPTLVTPVRFDSSVQQLVLLQLRHEQEAFLTDAADVRTVATVLPHVVQVQVSQVEGLPAGVAGELFVLGMALLMHLQSSVGAEAPQTGSTAERLHHSLPPPRHSLLNLVLVDEPLVLLQLTVIKKRLPTQVAHKSLLHTVNLHVGLQSPGTREALSTCVTPVRLLPVVEAQVSLEVVLEAEAESTGGTGEGFLP